MEGTPSTALKFKKKKGKLLKVLSGDKIVPIAPSVTILSALREFLFMVPYYGPSSFLLVPYYGHIMAVLHLIT